MSTRCRARAPRAVRCSPTSSTTTSRAAPATSSARCGWTAACGAGWASSRHSLRARADRAPGAVLCLAESKETAEDENAIRKVLADEAEAFNRHEGNLIPAAYSEHFDAVISNGVRIPGKPDLTAGFKAHLRNAQKIQTVQRIRFVRPDVAIVDGTFEYTGTAIKPYPKGLQTVVLTKENGRWVMTAVRSMIPATPPQQP